MKKKLCVLLALLMVFATAACSAQGPTDTPSSVPGGEAGSASSATALPGEAQPSSPPEPLPPATMVPKDEAEMGGAIISNEDNGRAYEYDSYYPPECAEQYLTIAESAAKLTSQEQTMTFSLKVDTASYTNVARYIESGTLPPADAVRTEELLNYFSYERRLSFQGDSPFALYTEVGPSPFDANRHMAFVRVKTRDIDKEQLPSSNLVFLIDTSGSMNSHDKLPLLKEAFSLLVETLDEDDMVSIVTYAGSSQVVLDSCPGTDKDRILDAIYTLSAGGSTAGADGIRTAYRLAEKNLMSGGNNRVILATDGDFNVGISTTEELETFIAEKRDGGVYLSILGFGTGNIRDDIMETLSKNGNGNYSYINSVSTAKKVLVDELGSNLFTIADDVKAQVEFNPQNVKSYRLIGYENRRLANEDFADDTKDAGEIGVGTDVVMLFELELYGEGGGSAQRYTSPAPQVDPDLAQELFFVRIRYKNPGEAKSNLVEQPAFFGDIPNRNTSDYQFACSVAAFGHLLRNSDYAGDCTVADTIALAKDNLGKDEGGYRLEYLMLLGQYKNMV